MILKHNSKLHLQPHLRNWQSHYAQHMNPRLMTRLLRKAVPVLEHVGWKVEEVAEGYAKTVLPLCTESTNQHGTHQAALIALSADYTGGLAVASLLTGVPLAGIHSCEEEKAASLWLADMAIRFRAPSTGHLHGECRVPQELATKIQTRYFSGKRVFVTLPVEFHSNGELIADAQMKYFAQPASQLHGDSRKVSPIAATKIKASARMIAGVRSQRPNFEQIRIDCPHTKQAATEHGELLAAKLQAALPQLTDMVHARTQHGDEALLAIDGLRQVIIVGSGLDMRPYRLFHKLPEVTWFELDLPIMLEERQRVISHFRSPPIVQRRQIAIDLRQDEIATQLRQHPDFDERLPTFVLYEGCSMYFSAQENRRILNSIRSLLKHPKSQLWCDMVAESVVRGESNSQEVDAFLKGMHDLGESFIFGQESPTKFLTSCSFEQVKVQTSADFLALRDPVLELYRFATAR